MGKGNINLNQKHKLEISSSNHHLQQPPLDYLFQSATSNSSFGSRAMLSFGTKSGTSIYVQDEYGDEYMDEYLNQPDKKRRLSLDQIHFLEKNFEMENKLEPDRKLQLAKDLGLQPRQIAVWFQNRKARWKTKHLETEYEALNASYEILKTNYENLVKENEKLKIEVLNLKQEESKDLGVEALKNEEQSSAKSDVTDEESPRLGDGIHSSSLIESDDSSLVFEIDPNKELLQPGYIFSNPQEPANSYYYGFQVEDHAFSFWSN